MSDKDGGPAFPALYPPSGFGIDQGMTLRDWFAGHCPDTELARRVPETMGDIVKLLAELGWISREVASGPDRVWQKYTDDHIHRLRARARYQYADTMLKERDKQ